MGIAPVVMFTDACVKASGAVATFSPNAKHFWCYWHIAKNVAKNLKGVLGHDTFTKLVRLMARAHHQVSIVVFEHMWNVQILGDPIFSSGHTYLSATWGALFVLCRLSRALSGLQGGKGGNGHTGDPPSNSGIPPFETDVVNKSTGSWCVSYISGTMRAAWASGLGDRTVLAPIVIFPKQMYSQNNHRHVGDP